MAFWGLVASIVMLILWNLELSQRVSNLREHVSELARINRWTIGELENVGEDVSKLRSGSDGRFTSSAAHESSTKGRPS